MAKTYREMITTGELGVMPELQAAERTRTISRLAAGPRDDLVDYLLGAGRTLRAVDEPNGPLGRPDVDLLDVEVYPVVLPGTRETLTTVPDGHSGGWWLRFAPATVAERRLATIPPPVEYPAGIARVVGAVLRGRIEAEGWGGRTTETIDPDPMLYEDMSIEALADRALSLAIRDGLSILHVMGRPSLDGTQRQVIEVTGVDSLMAVEMTGNETRGVLLRLPADDAGHERAVSYEVEGAGVVQTMWIKDDSSRGATAGGLSPKGQEWRQDGTYRTVYSQVPVVPLYNHRVGPWIATPPYAAGAAVAIQYADVLSHIGAAAAAGAYATPVLMGINEGETPDLGGKLGYVALGPDQSATMLQAVGAPGLTALVEYAEILRERLDYILPTFPDGETAAEATATAMRINVRETELVITQAARWLERALTAALARVAEAYGEPIGTVVVDTDTERTEAEGEEEAPETPPPEEEEPEEVDEEAEG
jgi:hypothetical protein